jgi:cytochrome c5
MKLKVELVKRVVFGLMIMLMLSTLILNSSSIRTSAAGQDNAGGGTAEGNQEKKEGGSEPDTASVYKSKCAMCHGPKAEKAFDTAKSDDTLVAAVLKGVKPKMPAYESSLGVEKSKALVTYMRQQRCAAPAPASE